MRKSFPKVKPTPPTITPIEIGCQSAPNDVAPNMIMISFLPNKKYLFTSKKSEQKLRNISRLIRSPEILWRVLLIAVAIFKNLETFIVPRKTKAWVSLQYDLTIFD